MTATKTIKTTYAILIQAPNGDEWYHGTEPHLAGSDSNDSKRMEFRTPKKAESYIANALAIKPQHLEIDSDAPACEAPVKPHLGRRRLVTAICSAQISEAGHAKTERNYLVGTRAFVVRLADGVPVDPDGTYAG